MSRREHTEKNPEEIRQAYLHVKTNEKTAFIYRRRTLTPMTEKLEERVYEDIERVFSEYSKRFCAAIEANKNQEDEITIIDEDILEKTDPYSDYACSAMILLFLRNHLEGLQNTIYEKYEAATSSDEEELNPSDKIQKFKSIIEAETESFLKRTEVSNVIENLTHDFCLEDMFHFKRKWLEKHKDRRFSCGEIYSPPNGNHDWLNNLSWLLAHFHKRSEFIISEEPTEALMKRVTPGHVGELTGFAREIATMHFLGWKLSKNNCGKLVFKSPAQPNFNIDSIKIRDGNLESMVNDLSKLVLTETDVEKHYRQVLEQLTQLNKDSLARTVDDDEPKNTKKLKLSESPASSLFNQPHTKNEKSEKIETDQPKKPPSNSKT